MSDKPRRNARGRIIRPTAPDGAPYPPPVVAVSKEEQKPWTFGHAPAAERDHDRTIVHSGRLDPHSEWLRFGNEPLHLISRALPTADYMLVREGEPVDGFVGIERKEEDLKASLTTYHDRFMEECDRLRVFTNPLIVASMSSEALIRKSAGREASIVGSIMKVCARFRIPPIFEPSRAMAERFAGWFLVDCWEAALRVNPDWLAWAREYDLRAEQTRLQRLQDEGDAASARAAFAAEEGPQVEERMQGRMPWAERQRRRQASK